MSIRSINSPIIFYWIHVSCRRNVQIQSEKYPFLTTLWNKTWKIYFDTEKQQKLKKNTALPTILYILTIICSLHCRSSWMADLLINSPMCRRNFPNVDIAASPFVWICVLSSEFAAYYTRNAGYAFDVDCSSIYFIETESKWCENELGGITDKRDRAIIFYVGGGETTVSRWRQALHPNTPWFLFSLSTKSSYLEWMNI